MKISARRLDVPDFWFDCCSRRNLSFHFYRVGVIVWWKR